MSKQHYRTFVTAGKINIYPEHTGSQWAEIIPDEQETKMLQMVIDRLLAGETIHNHVESGHSMEGLISHREPVTIAPVDAAKLEVNDIVLVKCRGRIYTHKIIQVADSGVLIGNNHGGINGWVRRNKVYGIVTHVNGVLRKSALSKLKETNE